MDRDHTVKVADFGLTRDIYQKDYYRQSSRGQVPVKWMAPESLLDHISSEKSDVVYMIQASFKVKGVHSNVGVFRAFLKSVFSLCFIAACR